MSPTRQCTACTHGLNDDGDCTNRRCELRAEPSGQIDPLVLARQARETARVNAAKRRTEGHALKEPSTMPDTGRWP